MFFVVLDIQVGATLRVNSVLEETVGVAANYFHFKEKKLLRFYKIRIFLDSLTEYFIWFQLVHVGAFCRDMKFLFLLILGVSYL